MPTNWYLWWEESVGTTNGPPPSPKNYRIFIILATNTKSPSIKQNSYIGRSCLKVDYHPYKKFVCPQFGF